MRSSRVYYIFDWLRTGERLAANEKKSWGWLKKVYVDTRYCIVVAVEVV